jgi:hypothetical protein
MYSEPFVNPPVYTAIILSNFFAIAFGFIFKDMLEYQVAQWNANRQTQGQINYKTPQIAAAYLGLTLFLTIFMGAGLSVFVGANPAGFDLLSWLAYGLAAIVVLPTALLVWVQLGSMLRLLVWGGSEAVDIDSYGAGGRFDAKAAPASTSKS